MTQSISFPSTTPKLSLPLLFPGQAQKEVFLNQAFAMVDALLPRTVAASLNSPPANPAEGACYRVAQAAAGEWAGHDDSIAMRIGGAWQFVVPVEGLTLYDVEAGSVLVYNNQWLFAETPAAPQGGNVIDLEVRQSLADLFNALETLGILRGAGTI